MTSMLLKDLLPDVEAATSEGRDVEPTGSDETGKTSDGRDVEPIFETDTGYIVRGNIGRGWSCPPYSLKVIIALLATSSE